MRAGYRSHCDHGHRPEIPGLPDLPRRQLLEPQGRHASRRLELGGHRAVDRARRATSTPTSARASGTAARSESRSRSVSRGTPTVAGELRVRGRERSRPLPDPGQRRDRGWADADGDRHAILFQRDRCRLYELFALRREGGRWTAGSGAIWDLRSNALRPAGWTSADAAGLPILPGLARYDEVARGRIEHALRFTVSSSRRAYVWPARHYASTLTGPSLPPMGAAAAPAAELPDRGLPAAGPGRAAGPQGVRCGQTGTHSAHVQAQSLFAPSIGPCPFEPCPSRDGGHPAAPAGFSDAHRLPARRRRPRSRCARSRRRSQPAPAPPRIAGCPVFPADNFWNRTDRPAPGRRQLRRGRPLDRPRGARARRLRLGSVGGRPDRHPDHGRRPRHSAARG